MDGESINQGWDFVLGLVISADFQKGTNMKVFFQKKSTGRFTSLGQQIFSGIMFDTVFHPFNLNIML